MPTLMTALGIPQTNQIFFHAFNIIRSISFQQTLEVLPNPELTVLVTITYIHTYIYIGREREMF
jgi:hypothetical protein